MSHVLVGELHVLDLNALKTSAENIGLAFRENQKKFKWYGRWVGDTRGPGSAYAEGYDSKTFGTCEHAIAVPNNPGAYEVGVVANNKGPGYVLHYDNWQGGYGLEGVAGRNLARLTEEYNAVVTERQLAAEGFETQRLRNAEQELQVVGIRR